ncbi:hypothetical protein Hanom_Chr06g00557591 [Helianthus anomalus]
MPDQFRLKVLTMHMQMSKPFRDKCLNHLDICLRNNQSEPLSVALVRDLNH